MLLECEVGKFAKHLTFAWAEAVVSTVGIGHLVRVGPPIVEQVGATFSRRRSVPNHRDCASGG